MKRTGISSGGGLKRSPMAAGGGQLKRSPMAAGTSTMKRSPMAASSAPMKRSPMAASSTRMKRSAPIARTASLANSSSLQRSWIKVEPPAGGLMHRRMRTKGPKMTPIRKSARGEACTLAIPGICRNRTDTTVWAHSNRLADGKGMGLKARDEAGCYACFECHSFLDGGWAAFKEWTYERVQQLFEVAQAASRAILSTKGLLKNDQ